MINTMTNKQYLFLFFPFLCFIFTYQILVFLLSARPISMPTLIGKPIAEVVAQLSTLDVNMRMLPSHILSQVEINIPADVVIAQVPAPGVAIKPNHTVFITLAQKQERLPAPQLIGLQDHEVIKKVSELGLKIKLYYLATNQPAGTCIAQVPNAGHEILESAMIAYVSAPASPIVLFPNFKGQNLETVRSFLEENNIAYQVHPKMPAILEAHSCPECVVCDQKPSPGILVNSQKNLSVHIYTTHEQN